MRVNISICIPAYNRPETLSPLLESILSQDYDDYEIVICEDNSPKQEVIREVANGFTLINKERIRYFENEENLGYDANLRNLLKKAIGDYCVFIGDDDLMAPGALSTVASALKRYENIGVVLRSYASFYDSPENINQVFKYFDKELFFPAGAETIPTFYRRSVVISGMVVHRKEALKYETNRFDGTLLYQLYLVANILVYMNGVYLPEILVLYRGGGTPYFGSSKSEYGKFVPTKQTPESSLHFTRGMLEIASWTEKNQNIKIYDSIFRDMGNYIYPFLSIQSRQPLPVFLSYSFKLAKMGFWKNKMFYLYFISIILLGSKRVDKIIQFVKNRLGHTPIIGKVYQGESK